MKNIDPIKIFTLPFFWGQPVYKVLKPIIVNSNIIVLLLQDQLLLCGCPLLPRLCIYCSQQGRDNGVSRLSLQEEKNCILPLLLSGTYFNILNTIQAQAASLTVAQAFNLAFSSWKDNQERKTENGNSAVAVTCCDQPSSCSIKVKPSPASREISEEAEESLLIDLRSPGDSLEDKTLATAFLVRLDSKEDYQQEEDMDLSFAK